MRRRRSKPWPHAYRFRRCGARCTAWSSWYTCWSRCGMATIETAPDHPIARSLEQSPAMHPARRLGSLRARVNRHASRVSHRVMSVFSASLSRSWHSSTNSSSWMSSGVLLIGIEYTVARPGRGFNRFRRKPESSADARPRGRCSGLGAYSRTAAPNRAATVRTDAPNRAATGGGRFLTDSGSDSRTSRGSCGPRTHKNEPAGRGRRSSSKTVAARQSGCPILRVLPKGGGRTSCRSASKVALFSRETPLPTHAAQRRVTRCRQAERLSLVRQRLEEQADFDRVVEIKFGVVRERRVAGAVQDGL